MFLVCGAFAAVLFTSLCVRAEAPSGEGEPDGQHTPVAASAPNHVIEVLLAGALGRDPSLSVRIASWFEPTLFSVSVRAVPAPNPARILAPERPGAIYVWVTLGPGSARLYYATLPAAGARPMYLVRELKLSNGLDEIGAEHIAEVLHLSTVALIEGAAQSDLREVEDRLKREASLAKPQGLASERAPAKRPPPRAPSSAAHSLLARPSLGLGYAVSLRTEQGLRHGPRIGVMLPVAPAFALQGLLGAGLPHSKALPSVTLAFASIDAGAALVWTRVLAPAIGGALSLGGVIEVTHFTPRQSPGPDVKLGQSGTDARAGMRAGVGAVFGRDFPQFALGVDEAWLAPRSDFNMVVNGVRRNIARSAPLATTLTAELRL